MKTRSKVGLLLVAVAVLSLSGCIVRDNGKKNREMRELTVKNFERIEIAGNFDVVYAQGTEHKVVAEGTKRQLDDLDVKCDGTTLTLRMKKMRLDGFRSSISISVVSPDLVSVGMSGNGDFQARGKVDTDNMRIRLTGNGDIDFDDLICDRLTAELTGNGDIDIDNLVAGSTELLLTGNGDFEVSGRTGTLKTQKAGNGDINTAKLDVAK